MRLLPLPAIVLLAIGLVMGLSACGTQAGSEAFAGTWKLEAPAPAAPVAPPAPVDGAAKTDPAGATPPAADGTATPGATAPAVDLKLRFSGSTFRVIRGAYAIDTPFRLTPAADGWTVLVRARSTDEMGKEKTDDIGLPGDRIEIKRDGATLLVRAPGSAEVLRFAATAD